MSMSLLLSGALALHLLFAGLWTGSVLFFTYSLLPFATGGELAVPTLEAAAAKLTMVSRVSAVLQLLTGAFLASPMGFGTSGYWSSTDGALVVVMVVLWLLLAAFTELAASRMTGGLDADTLRSNAETARNWLYLASVVAVLVLLDAGLLAGL